MTVDMAVDLAGVRLPNPMMTASGCAASGREMHRFIDVAELGAFVTPSVKLAPVGGRGSPRMAETDSGMLSATGLPGPGVKTFVEKDLAWLHSIGARVVVSVAGSTASEYAAVARTVVRSRYGSAVAAIEVNISSPDLVAPRGQVVASDPARSHKVLTLVREEVPRGIPILAKLSPDVTDIVEIAAAVLKAGAHGLTMINTPLGVAIDTDRLRPRLVATTGGLSGPAVRPMAVRAIWQVVAAMREGRIPTAPVVGVGGVRTGLDAIELVAAGACAVQIGTAAFHDPTAPLRVGRELADALEARGATRLADIVGIAHDGGLT